MGALDPVRSIVHGCVQFESDDRVIVVDPFMVSHATHDADLIIITHPHSDHFSPEDIEKLRRDDTCFVTTHDLAKKLISEMGVDSDYISIVSCDSPSVGFECGAAVTPLVAENKNHPAGFGFGVLLEFDGYKYYLSGDTDTIDEDIACDVLFICCDGIYNMPQFETRIPALIKSMTTMPKMTVPYHYGLDGMEENGARLIKALKSADIPCKLI
ncbi:MAG: MBL fold metallo-hydrolase [Clostridia bacterium]|nr:MBL fold metallo-hydrolase [Clostridia bacterium]NLS84648.1 MBL fold metallo-hydrolase [Oscillospiraceae bacterium]